MTMTRSIPLPLLDDVSISDCDESALSPKTGFGALETARGRLPLAAIDVAGRIDGLLSQVTVCQTFVNTSDLSLEATYIFPLPDRAAVTGFRMEVAGRVIEGVLEERGQARCAYAQAVHQGNRAAIAEEERPGVFTLRVGNLMPGDVATMRITMVGVLPYRDGEVTFRFPLVVAPRYIPGVPLSGPSVGDGTAVDTNLVPDASRISPPVLLPGFPNPVRLSLLIELYEWAAPVDDLRVSLFTVCGEEQGGVRRLILQPGERLDRDFILRFRLGGDSVRTSLSLHPDSSGTGEGTFALTIVPPAAGEAAPQRPRDVVFVLDRSGSMEGWKMVAARRAMARMIDTLIDSDRLAVFAFDDRIEMPRRGNGMVHSQLIPASDRNRFTAVEFLATLESRGGTEIAQPLNQAVRLLGEPETHSDRDRDRILVLVTDGQVGNEDQVLRELGQRPGGIIVFALGIDQAVNEGFLRRLAALGAGGSSCELVESEDRLSEVMDSIHRWIGTPVVSDVRLHCEKAGIELIADTLVPDRPPCLFAGSPLVIMGRYRGLPSGSMEVRATTPSGVAWRELVVANVRDNPALTSAWARGHVRQLEDRYAARRGDRSALEQTIITTALRFGVLCRFTAYVAVDRAAVVNEGGKVHRITQPVEMPAGWGEPGSSTTACFTTPQALRASCSQTFSSAPPQTAFRKAQRDLIREMISLPLHAHATSRRAVPPPPPPALSADELLHRAGFDALEEIGRDHQGTLYKGRDRRGRIVSILVLANPVTLGADFAKLQREVKALKHPMIVRTLHFVGDFRRGLVLAVVSEPVAGPTLTQWVSQVGLPDPRAAAVLVLGLADALEYAAQKIMTHGHLTSGTIRMTDDGTPRITGFGLARIDFPRAVPHDTDQAYIAPELLQTKGARPTAQSDVYGLGVVCYQLLTGLLTGGDRCSPRPPRELNLQVPTDLERICLKALAADPAARFATAAEFAAGLREFLGIKKPGMLGRLTGRSKPITGARKTRAASTREFLEVTSPASRFSSRPRQSTAVGRKIAVAGGCSG